MLPVPEPFLLIEEISDLVSPIVATGLLTPVKSGMSWYKWDLSGASVGGLISTVYSKVRNIWGVFLSFPQNERKMYQFCSVSFAQFVYFFREVCLNQKVKH